MTFKKSIKPQEMVDFVNAVVNTCTIDGLYVPALFDFAIRVNAIFYFSDYAFEKNEDELIEQDKASEVVFETGVYDEILQKTPQLYVLISACKEQIRINHDIVLASLKPADQMERLVNIIDNTLGNLSDTTKNFSPEMIENLSGALASIDENKLVTAIGEMNHKQSTKSKGNRGRPKGSTNKKKDNTVHLPGEMKLEDFTKEVIDTNTGD